MTSPKALSRMMALAVLLATAAIAAAQAGGPQVQFRKNGQPDVNAQLNFVLKAGPKGTSNAGANGMVSLPGDILSSNKPHTHFDVIECPDGTLYAVEDGATDPCPHHHRRLGGFYLDDSGMKVFDEVPVAGFGGGGQATTNGLPISLQLDVQPGIMEVGAFSGLCQSLSTGETCTKDSTEFKFNLAGAILFGRGWFSAGPLFGEEFRKEIKSNLDCPSSSSSCEGFLTETLGVRANSFNIGARESVRLWNSPFRLNFDEGKSITSIRDRIRITSGSGTSTTTSTETSNSTLAPSFFGASLVYAPWKCTGISVGYRYTNFQFAKSSSSGSSSIFDEEIHDNDILFGLTFFFGGGKD